MRQFSRILALLCAISALCHGGYLFANCNESSTVANYPIRQCVTAAGGPSWFAPPPPGSGTVSATWWILGFGNRAVVDPSLGANVEPTGGSGFVTGSPSTTNHGTWIGNDSGNLTAGVATGSADGGLDLLEAGEQTGVPEATGGFCFSFGASWGLPFVDGCADLNRSYASLGGAGQLSDNYLNIYWSGQPGSANYTTYNLVDSPMGVLLKESNNNFFSAAFFQSTTRNASADDIFDRGWDMGAIDNGDANPGAPGGNNNVISWQAVPDPNISAAIDPNGNRVLNVNWSSIRLVHDASSRLNGGATTDPAASNRHVLGTPAPAGVGVLEQPELVSYVLERKPLIDVGGGIFDCDPNSAWSNAGPPAVPAITLPAGSPLGTQVVVPGDTCVRLTTRLGRAPTVAFRNTGTASSNRTENRLDAQAGNFGDVGFEVSSDPPIKVAGVLLSDTPVLRGAAWSGRNLVVNFETLAEIEVQSFDVMVRDRRGTATQVLSVDCTQCSGGIGAGYHVEIPGTALRSAKTVFIVAQPSGASSAEVAIERSTMRPEPPPRSAPRR